MALSWFWGQDGFLDLDEQNPGVSPARSYLVAGSGVGMGFLDEQNPVLSPAGSYLVALTPSQLADGCFRSSCCCQTAAEPLPSPTSSASCQE